MAQVICKSKAGAMQPQLGGVRFFRSAVGHISEEISDEKAAEFMETPDHFVMHLGDPIEAPGKKGRETKTDDAKGPKSGSTAPTPQGAATGTQSISDPTF